MGTVLSVTVTERTVPAVTLSPPLIGFLSMNNRTYEKVKKMSISRGFLLAKTETVLYN
jgi:hypothetical protein